MSVTSAVTRGVTRGVTWGVTNPGGWGGVTPNLWYDFVAFPSLAATVGPTLSITRATTAWMKDADGWLREMQSGEARFPGATFNHNLVLQSETLDNASWTKTRSSISADAIANPVNASVTADKLVEDATASSTHFMLQTRAVEIGKSYLFSFYAKAAERSEINFAFSAAGFPNNSDIWFDLSDGTVGTIGAGGVDDSGMEDVGNGWYRCWAVKTSDETSGTSNCAVFLGSGSETNSYNGDGSSGAYIYGVQFEDVSGAWDSDNMLLQSNDFDTTWTNTNTTETSGKADPDGGTSAWSLNEDGTAANTHFLSQAITFSDPGRYSFSVRAKASNRNWLNVRFANYANAASTFFNLSDGTIATDSAVSSSITSLGDGWYLCEVVADITSDDLIGAVRFYIAEADNDTTFDGLTQESVLIYQAQLEKTKPNQTAPGTYTATTTAAVTNYSPSPYIATTTAAVSSLSGTSDGLLVEEARTNICLRSEEFNVGANWGGAENATVANQILAPDGSLTADKFIDDAGATGQVAAYHSQNVTVSTSTAYTFSVFAKADQLDWVALLLTGFTTPAGAPDAFFDLANGVVGTVAAGFDDSGIEDYGNGWYRCWVSFTTDATDTTGAVRIYLAEADSDRTVDDDGTSSIFVWGAQLEAGAFPTAYIPTTTGSVTRNADAVDPSTTVGWYGSTGHTIYTHGAVLQGSLNNGEKIPFATTGGDAIYHRLNNTNGTFVSIGFSSTVVLSGSAPSSAETETRMVSAFLDDDSIQYLDGSADGTDTSSDASVGSITNFYIGRNIGGSYWNGLIKEIRYYNTRLTNAQLLNLSNGIDP